MATIPLMLLTPPRLQFFDDNGDPLENGQMKFFVVGTSTPLEVFADADGNTSLGTVVDLDAAGRPTDGMAGVAIYLQNLGGYKVELFDQNAVMTNGGWSQDQVANVAESILATWGNVLAQGSKSVDTGYTVTSDDNLVTVDGSTNPATLNLQASEDRGLPLTIINLAGVVLVTPNGAQTINGVAGAYSMAEAASPFFPWITLYPDGSSGYLMTAGPTTA